MRSSAGSNGWVQHLRMPRSGLGRDGGRYVAETVFLHPRNSGWFTAAKERYTRGINIIELTLNMTGVPARSKPILKTRHLLDDSYYRAFRDAEKEIEDLKDEEGPLEKRKETL